MLLDYHIHTSLSDGNEKHEKYINVALKKGISEIGFSDHIDLKNPNWQWNSQIFLIWLKK